MLRLLSTASKNTTNKNRRIGYQEKLSVYSKEQIATSKKRAVIVTAVLTAVFVSIITFILCQGLPAKMFASQVKSLEIPTLTTEDDYIVQFNTVHTKMVNLYKVPPKKADEYTSNILNHAYPDFPTADDIMAVIKIESNWDENARSVSDARGLMQVLHGDYRVQDNISQGTAILREYYEILKNKQAAVIAYNVGIGSYQSGLRNDGYYKGYQSQVALIKTSVANL